MTTAANITYTHDMFKRYLYTCSNATYTHVQALLIHMFKSYLYTCSNVTHTYVQTLLIHMFKRYLCTCSKVCINYRLPIKVYYRICTLRHIRIEINHGSQNVF
jgi:hypothetical protein